MGRRLAVSAALLLLAGLAPAAAAAQDSAGEGKAVYDRWCAGCHGAEGRGDGPAAGRMLPRPRDFTRALYQVRTTPSGGLPTDADLLHVIDVGMPGSAMPGWEDKLSRQERAALVDYLKTFSPFFETEPAPQAIAAGRAPSADDAALAEGRALYERIECWKCHGQAGRGDGPSAADLEGDDGAPIAAADLTEAWHFNGGASTEAIYMRLRTGLDGTPMPSFSDLIDSEFITEEQLWNVAQYVRSLSPRDPPRVREVVRAREVEGTLPGSPADPLWTGVERFYVPLVGQVIEPPRWFAPRVDGVWVQALHDGERVALRLAWSDPSRSPDPAWRPWRERVAAVMDPVDGAVDAPAALPDAFAVQFPRAVPEGRTLPYFLMGDAREPVYLWRWRSDAGGAEEVLARGLGRTETLPGDGGLEGAAEFVDGQWRVVLRRSLRTADESDRLQFVRGAPVPVAFYAWDGDNGESGTRGAISSWYYLYLDEPASRSVFVAPIAATLLTLTLGLAVVVRAQRRESQGAAPAPPAETEP